MTKENAPGREAQGVGCHFAGDIEANIIRISRTQFLRRCRRAPAIRAERRGEVVPSIERGRHSGGLA